MRHIWIIVYSVVTFSAWGSSSWGEVTSSVIENGLWKVRYNWGINLGDPPAVERTSCEVGAGCLFFPGPLNGIPMSGTVCGGAPCKPADLVLMGIPFYQVQFYDQDVERLYRLFADKYGTSGSVEVTMRTPPGFVPPPYHPNWGIMCIGFGVVKNNGPRPHPVESSHCGKIAHPPVGCSIDIVDTVDMGVIPTGRVSKYSSPVFLQVQCSGTARISAALTRDDHKLAGVPLRMEIDGTRISTRPITVFNGVSTTLPVVFAISGEVKKAGVFQEPVPVLLNYY